MARAEPRDNFRNNVIDELEDLGSLFDLSSMLTDNIFARCFETLLLLIIALASFIGCLHGAASRPGAVHNHNNS